MFVKTILMGKARGTGIVTITPDASIAEAARLLSAHRIGALVAVDGDGHLAGILSERDIVRGLANQDNICQSAKVRDLMTAAVVTCREEDSIDSLMQTMTNSRIRHLPVLDQSGRVIGIVTIGDVVKSRLDQADMEVDNLRQYVAAGA